MSNRLVTPLRELLANQRSGGVKVDLDLVVVHHRPIPPPSHFTSLHKLPWILQHRTGHVGSISGAP
jgi:hypothetical protein